MQNALIAIGGRACLLNGGSITNGEDGAVAADDAQVVVCHDGPEVCLPGQLSLRARSPTWLEMTQRGQFKGD